MIVPAYQLHFLVVQVLQKIIGCRTSCIKKSASPCACAQVSEQLFVGISVNRGPVCLFCDIAIFRRAPY
jgi:hypothetical protein